jgi:hypothetical protein
VPPAETQTSGQAPLGGSPSTVLDLSEAALQAAGEEGREVGDAGRLLDDARQLFDDLAKAVRKISRAVSRLMRDLGRLEHEADRIGDRLFNELSRDITHGRFDDGSQDKAISRALDRFGHLAERAEHVGENFLEHILRDITTGALADEAQTAALAVSYSQSITVSVQSLEILVQDGDDTVLVNYQSISLSVTTTVGIALAQTDPQVLDVQGNPVDTATIDSGLFFDSSIESVAELVARLRQAGAPQQDTAAPPIAGGLLDLALPTAEGEPVAAPDAGAAAALEALILIREVSYSASLGITRILLDAASPVADRGPADVAEAAGSSSAAANLDLQI